ncbi:helix-turn-helix domain-containing protein [Streptomyces sp. NPDC057499]|uniref:helix-turn-helix domain-containing protein n=1 Tax=Streptomyces sp. NPDC057499 TaxID=3346150 RepID=UPI003687A05D
MENRSLSANALAKASGVNRQVIGNILHGSVWPDSLTVMDLEDALAAEICKCRSSRRRSGRAKRMCRPAC